MVIYVAYPDPQHLQGLSVRPYLEKHLETHRRSVSRMRRSTPGSTLTRDGGPPRWLHRRSTGPPPRTKIGPAD